MDSGIIFPIIIGLWAAFLVPHWIRRRQQLSASRSVDRFSDAMRVLDRRDDARGVVRPQTSHSYLLRPPRAPVKDLAPGEVVQAAPRSASRPAVRPGRRPRAALSCAVLMLMLATPVTGVLAVLGTAPGWAPAVALGLLLMAVGRLRALVRRRSGRSSRSRVSRVAVAAPAAAAVPAPSPAVEKAVVDDGVTAEPGSWTPVPVPVPTYMLKPMAPARRVAPWQEEPAAASAEPEPVSTRAVPDLDAVLERRRAAGE